MVNAGFLNFQQLHSIAPRMFLMSNECGQFQIDPVAKAGGFLKGMIEEFKLKMSL